ncbi:MAG: MG2 domain-containing protein [Planctomycetia bacterium]
MRRSRLLAAFLLVASAALALQATADPLAGERKAALREAQEGLRDRRWAEAAQALAALRTRYPGSEEAVEAWVLEARALLAAGKAREALESTSAFLAAHGQEAWAGRVRHTAVEAHIALGEPAQASELMQRLADAAAAPEARAAIGLRHLALADGDFDGVATKDDLGREVKKRDVPRALVAYRLALEVGLPPARVPAARERVAQCLEETGDAAGALAAWSALVEEDDKAKEAAAAPDVAERWRVGRGRAALKAGQADLARTTLAAALERFPQGALRLETLRLLGEERLTPRGGQVDGLAFEEGVTWLVRAVREHRDDPRSMQAQRRLAEAYESRGQSEKAAREWAALVDRAPEDAGAPEARDRAAAALAKAGRFDDAIAEWNRFLVAYANHPLWPGVREKVAAAAYEKAAALLARGDTAGAVAAWKQFAEQRPDDRRAPEALAAAATALSAAKDHEGALTLWRALAGRYASTSHAPAARLAVARTLEDALGRLDEAVAAYEEIVRLHPRSPQAGEARERLARLKGKHLELRMERVQGTGEPASVRVATRNIEALKVRVYRLGLEEYFRRKGTLEGVEGLQLEVVKADVTSEWKLEGYKPFVLTEADRPLPVKEAGAYVVVAGDDDLTATVLTLRSDIECIVKRGAGGDLLVWAFARAGQAPAAGARVLAATGSGVREAGVTGADGTWHGEEPEGFTGRLLVLAGGGAAGTEIERGPAVASVFSARAFVSTDRPVYRPGQEVAWRAIHLDVQGQRYAVAPGMKAVARLLDPRGQEVERKEVQAGELGTFEGRFAIDGEAPLGRWTVSLAIGPREVQAAGAFEVQEFRKPEFSVDVLPGRSVVRTGEAIEARLRLAYAFGGPVPGAEVEWVARRQPRAFEAPPAEDLSWYVRSASDAADRERATTSAPWRAAAGAPTPRACWRSASRPAPATRTPRW